jgi:hypothetical protein
MTPFLPHILFSELIICALDLLWYVYWQRVQARWEVITSVQVGHQMNSFFEANDDKYRNQIIRGLNSQSTSNLKVWWTAGLLQNSPDDTMVWMNLLKVILKSMHTYKAWRTWDIYILHLLVFHERTCRQDLAAYVGCRTRVNPLVYIGTTVWACQGRQNLNYWMCFIIYALWRIWDMRTLWRLECK